MMNKLVKGLVATAVLAALAGCNSSDDDNTPQTACEAAGDACTQFTVLHTNDNHGRFWQNKNGEYGMAARKTVIDQIRTEVERNGGETILLSGGDINTGVPESDMQDAVPDFIGMSMLGYDAMAVGNHEFDNPLTTLDMQATIAQFPMLAANIYKKDSDGNVTSERYFEPYRVFDINGLKVAIIGFTTVDTPKVVSPDNVASLHFTDPQSEISIVLAEIEANEKVDMVFALTHMGHYANGEHGTEAAGDVKLAESVAKGQLQAIIGGHSQNPVCMEGDGYADFKPGDECKPDQKNGTYIMQAHEWGKYVGRADFEFMNGELTLASYKLIPINLKVENENEELVFVTEEIEQDQLVIDALEHYQTLGQELLDVVISSTDGKLEGDRNVVRAEQTNLGQLLTRAYGDWVTTNFEPTVDFGVMNSGGVRDSIVAGPVSYRDVLTVQPFSNDVAFVTMSGTEVQQYLADVALKTGGGMAQLYPMEMNVTCDAVEIDPEATAADIVEITSLGKRAFKLEDSYTFSLINFSAKGGDDYPKLTGHANYVDTQRSDASVLREYFENNPEIKVADYNPVNGGHPIFYRGGAIVKSCAK
ncbi:bifunctional UDP-sugar hydrolase/5'-nucleotidase UshA [Shewanella sp. D64]|uniref:bifunctional UDP-sugar hydrolase/5'-nucleotidase UshA n=1 Tax=unclassified Shewanella TaxID=196818 RepID=UPI0022BA53C2|nr:MULTISPECIES: bifunctional UDP-sugar hydrolase/5'-nucleotidase UshA [unclassified Shewanella]MEC4724809.1 bifunctional UDP-sugar hydrolase/5'-nucleotidase UshA [Shewanella sp. D64]MEC4736397.1 bifunctional UDP-sugar hydrolase/5'-nucleotidase UshA [Shewanella sp. E94]WBJ97544.1 bifunctional UDP-sugar hydrolase/5'-nucleotidase UshA [Shewanella sp. MTB7]